MNAKKIFLSLFAWILPFSAFAAGVGVTVVYPAGAAIPADAKLEVEVLDEFAADAPNVVAHSEMPASPAPKAFQINTGGSPVQGNHPYSLAVAVKSGDQYVLYAPEKYSVLTMGHPSRVVVKLASVSKQPEKRPYGPALEETYWKLISVEGAAAPVSYQREPYLLLSSFQQKLSGTGGCNNFLGGYTVTGDGIAFDKVAATRMACRPGTNSDDALLKALNAAKKWRIADDRLDLEDQSGARLASFHAIPPIPALAGSQ